MLSGKAFRAASVKPVEQPVRPSHFNEDLNEVVPRNNTDLDYATEGAPEEYGFEPPPMAPIPTYQTEPPPVALRTVRTTVQRLSVDDRGAIRVAGNDPRRVRLFVRALSSNTDSVFLLDNPNQAVADGFELTSAGNDDVEMFGNTEIWARCLSTETGVINVVTEFMILDE